MRWPWKRNPEPETRSGVGYTASLTAALEAGATGAIGDSAPIATAAVEAAAGLYARCLAAAVVKDAGPGERALSPAVLATIGRNLIRRGEDHHRIYVRAGRVYLAPIGFAHAHGNDPDPMRWTYNVTMYGPTDSKHEWTAAPAILHCRYATDSSRPWLGVPPWSWAFTSSEGLANLEGMIRDKAKAPYGELLSVPEAPQTGEDEDTEQLAAFRSDVAKAKGKTLVAESPALWDDAASGMRGLQTQAFGITKFGMGTDHAHALRTPLGQDILAASGVPPTLFVANSDGTAQREAFRRFLHSSLRPVAKLIEDEARLKLDAPNLTLDLSEIHAADVAGRARSFAAFVKAGVDPEDAAANTGVVLSRPVKEKQDGSNSDI